MSITNKAEISREPEIPDLNDRQWELVEKIVTYAPELKEETPDIIFVFGASYVDADIIKSAYDRYCGKVSILLVGGEVGVINENKQTSEKIPLSHRIKKALVQKGIPGEHIRIIDNKSTNTKEDVLPLRYLNDFSAAYYGERITNILAIAKAFHTGRAWLTLKQHMPGTTIGMMGYELTLEGEKISRDDTKWKKILWGEFTRILRYSSTNSTNKTPDIASVNQIPLDSIEKTLLTSIQQIASLAIT